MQSHSDLIFGKVRSISVVTPVISKPRTSQKSKMSNCGGIVQRTQPLSLVGKPGQIFTRPPSSSPRTTLAVASEPTVSRKRRVMEAKTEKYIFLRGNRYRWPDFIVSHGKAQGQRLTNAFRNVFRCGVEHAGVVQLPLHLENSPDEPFCISALHWFWDELGFLCANFASHDRQI
jgi:hypothetical protein